MKVDGKIISGTARARGAVGILDRDGVTELLFDRVRHTIEGTAKRGDQRLLVPELVRGGSVGPPPAAASRV